MKRAAISIDQALRDRNLLGAALGDIPSWETWLIILRATFGLPLDDKQRELFSQVAGNRTPPAKRVSEVWAVCGRRSGKTRMAAAIAVFIATIEQHRLSS